jgi:hypothetical protein
MTSLAKQITHKESKLFLSQSATNQRKGKEMILFTTGEHHSFHVCDIKKIHGIQQILLPVPEEVLNLIAFCFTLGPLTFPEATGGRRPRELMTVETVIMTREKQNNLPKHVRAQKSQVALTSAASWLVSQWAPWDHN